MRKIPDARPDAKTGRLIYRRVFPPALRPFNPEPNVELKCPIVTLPADTPGFWQRYAAANAEYERITEIATRHQSDHIKRSLGETTPLTEELIVSLSLKYREDGLFLMMNFVG